MNSFKLSLPTDIPWKRICVSADMLDPIPCDAARPDKWRSSLAVFRYDPPDEYQSLADSSISYLKVVATVVPYAPEINVDQAQKYLPPTLVSELEEAYPCYGAILQVTLAPTDQDSENFTKQQFPHFVDFEPKKRELYEAVTDTGEVLSASSATLAVGKSAGTTDSTENYNLDLGWNFGMQGSYAGTGGGFNVGDQKQVGEVHKSGFQRQDIRTTEESVERRERQSHTTQLAQMYNLFQAFHLGTNRAVFFMEPRPHIRQSEATFINGPRALEGMQEVFMVVVHPRAMTDYCVSALLETAHLVKEPQYEYDTRSDLLQFRLFAPAQNKDTTSGETDWTETVVHTETYTPPAGFEIDLGVGNGGYTYRVLREHRRRQGPIFSVTPTSLSVYGEVTWRFWETGFWNDDHYDDGYLDIDVTIYLKAKEPRLKEYVDKLFLSARDLCCCAQDEDDVTVSLEPWIPWVTRLPLDTRVEVYHGFGNRRRFYESRRLASAVREQMIQSLYSSKRADRGKVTYQRSDVFMGRVRSLLRLRRPTRETGVPIEKSRVLSGIDRNQLHHALGSVTVDDLLDMSSYDLSKALQVEESQAIRLKGAILADLAAMPRSPERPRASVSATQASGGLAGEMRDVLKNLLEAGHLSADQLRKIWDDLLGKPNY
jgi:hypothetical protein